MSENVITKQCYINGIIVNVFLSYNNMHHELYLARFLDAEDESLLKSVHKIGIDIR